VVIDDRLTVVTLTLPERAAMLEECLASVRDQTVHPCVHHVEWDMVGGEFVGTANTAVAAVNTPFFNMLDDDDLFLPNHVEVMMGVLDAEPDVDVVWTGCEVRGRDISFVEEYQPGLLQVRPYIPSNLMMRTEVWRMLGGYRDMFNADWDLLARAETAGARFLRVPVVTWVYRFHGSNLSMGQR